MLRGGNVPIFRPKSHGGGVIVVQQPRGVRNNNHNHYLFCRPPTTTRTRTTTSRGTTTTTTRAARSSSSGGDLDDPTTDPNITIAPYGHTTFDHTEYTILFIGRLFTFAVITTRVGHAGSLLWFDRYAFTFLIVSGLVATKETTTTTKS